MKAATYTLHREGQFFANLDPCDQCGGTDQKTFRYDVDITVEELDDHGFTLDNRHVGKAFDAWVSGKWIASCEDLAAGGLRNLHAQSAGRAIKLRVRIIANGDSWIESNWELGQTLPQRRPLKQVEEVASALV